MPGRPWPLRRLGRWTLHAGVALGLLGLVLWRANPWQLGDYYRSLDAPPLAGAVLLNVPLLLLFTLRGRFILGRMGYHFSFAALAPISILGNVAGSLTPASAGDLLRPSLFKERLGVPYADGLAAVIYERAFSLFVLAVATGIVAAWSGPPLEVAAVATGVGLAIILIAPAAAALALDRIRHVLPSSDGPHEGRTRLRQTLAGLGQSLEALLLLLADRRGTAWVVLVNLAIFAVMAAQLWLVAHSLDLTLSPAESSMALGTALLAGIATVLPLGLGTLDATLAAGVGATEDGFGAGAATAVLLRATVTLPLGFAAFGSYLYLLAKRRRLTPREANVQDSTGGEQQSRAA